jgi:hypothetical protein
MQSLRQHQQQEDYFHTPQSKQSVSEAPTIGSTPVSKETINEAIDHGIKDVEKQWTNDSH